MHPLLEYTRLLYNIKDINMDCSIQQIYNDNTSSQNNCANPKDDEHIFQQNKNWYRQMTGRISALKGEGTEFQTLCWNIIETFLS